ncbi:unnamed protein product [Lactuca saligna]|uniref:Uncharacterized protein n=1 Tax=Lactuca saligna TaxID=75948 RepID=A0AA35VDF2_LACSI|nr:unnamed protein product [Lactuca saligna]
MPNWITERSNGPSISFTIPSSSNNLTGLNFCCVLASPFHQQPLNNLPKIIISNITKTRTWICHHYLEMVFLRRNGLTLLSHWMFGMNEMECGDHVTVTVRWTPHDIGDAVIKECGMVPALKSECSSELSLEESLYWRMTPKVITRIAYRAKFLGAWERGYATFIRGLLNLFKPYSSTYKHVYTNV